MTLWKLQLLIFGPGDCWFFQRREFFILLPVSFIVGSSGWAISLGNLVLLYPDFFPFDHWLGDFCYRLSRNWRSICQDSRSWAEEDEGGLSIWILNTSYFIYCLLDLNPILVLIPILDGRILILVLPERFGRWKRRSYCCYCTWQMWVCPSGTHGDISHGGSWDHWCSFLWCLCVLISWTRVVVSLTLALTTLPVILSLYFPVLNPFLPEIPRIVCIFWPILDWYTYMTHTFLSLCVLWHPYF